MRRQRLLNEVVVLERVLLQLALGTRNGNAQQFGQHLLAQIRHVVLNLCCGVLLWMAGIAFCSSSSSSALSSYHLHCVVNTPLARASKPFVCSPLPNRPWVFCIAFLRSLAWPAISWLTVLMPQAPHAVEIVSGPSVSSSSAALVLVHLTVIWLLSLS